MVKVLELPQDEVMRSIRNGQVRIAVVGLGYVGLPLATLFAIEGGRILGCDIDQELVDMINKGRSRIVEHDLSWLLDSGAETLDKTCPNCGVQLFSHQQETFCPSCGRLASIEGYRVILSPEISEVHKTLNSNMISLQSLLEKVIDNGNLRATTETASAVAESDVILIAVGTPLREKNMPDKSAILSASRAIAEGLEGGDLVIVKSTVPPGTTEGDIKPILEEGSNLKCGEDFGLAHMPERIKEGYALFEFKTIPRIVGGVDQRSAEAAASVFSIFPAPIHIFDKTAITETAKLFENTYRDMNIALVNELAIICERIEVDAIEAIRAANTDPKTHLLIPGLVGGYCLPKDPYFLVNEGAKKGYNAKLIRSAREVNEMMPDHTIELVIEVFGRLGIPLKESKISLLGLSFKGGSGDLRNSASIPILRRLARLEADIWAHDPLVDFDELRDEKDLIILSRELKEVVSKARCLIIVTDHPEYRTLKPSLLAQNMSLPGGVVDCRHIFDPEEFTDPNLTYRGLGHPFSPRSTR